MRVAGGVASLASVKVDAPALEAGMVSAMPTGEVNLKEAARG